MQQTDDLKRVERALSLASAYAQVFGLPGERSPAQSEVWEDFMRRTYDGITTLLAHEGQCDALRFACAEGRRQIGIEVKALLAKHAASMDGNKNNKPKVIT